MRIGKGDEQGREELPEQENAKGGDALPAEELIADDLEEEEEAKERSEVEVLQEEVALLGQQMQQMRDRYIRAVADLDNARKRARQAIAEAREQGSEGVLLDLLGLMDNFERALETSRPSKASPQEMKAIYEGVELIYRQLRSLLERRGVTEIEAVGEQFDPSRHEAVAQMLAEKGQREGTIAVEMQKGYMHRGKVLRPSRVGVVVEEK